MASASCPRKTRSATSTLHIHQSNRISCYHNQGNLNSWIPAPLQDLNKESKRIARYRARMDSVDKWMSKRHLPKSLRSRIGHHYQEVRSHSLAALLRALSSSSE